MRTRKTSLRTSFCLSEPFGKLWTVSNACIVQRRLIEGNVPRLRGEARGISALIRSPLADHKDGGGGGDGEEQRSESTADDSTEERESPEESERSLRTDEEEEEEEVEEDSEAAAKPTPDAKAEEGTASLPPLAALVVQCKCCEGDVTASIDTGCQHNHISSLCCRRLGLVPEPDSAGPTRTVRGLQLQLGSQRVQCSAYVKDDEVSELCLGLQTLLELKCCVDLSGRVLRLPGSGEELPFLAPAASGVLRPHHDTNENL
ncbi:unnamed protein product [Merluccius merluccius]